MSSVLMWEVMSMVCMRSVLSSAMGAMHTVRWPFRPHFSLSLSVLTSFASAGPVAGWQLVKQMCHTHPAPRHILTCCPPAPLSRSKCPAWLTRWDLMGGRGKPCVPVYSMLALPTLAEIPEIQATHCS